MAVRSHQAGKKFADTGESWKVRRKADRLDNAVAGSFFTSLKAEWICESRRIAKRQMGLEMVEYVEIRYSQDSHHGAWDNRTIEGFGNKYSICKKNCPT